MPKQVPEPGRGEAQAVALARLTAAQLPQALALSAQMDWPYRLEDWTFAHGLGHGLALEVEGRVAATGMWWPNGEAFATAGMIIVAQALQGRGLGARLFDALLGELGARTVMLNSTAEGLQLYRRRGFDIVGEIHQHQGVLGAVAPRTEPGLRPAEAAEFDAIVGLDEAAAGRPRRELLKRLAAHARFTVLERQGVVVGYAASRPFGRGHVVGPVVAAHREQAQALVAAAAGDLVGEFVRVDTPSELGLTPWLKAVGLGKAGAATTMVRGTPPRARPDARVFALCSQSLG